MSIQEAIAQKTQCNYRLNRKILHLKHCWDEVRFLLDAACKRKHCYRMQPPTQR